jgi:DeoR/GlpR family transcriptional regulator of sugar metabolism
VFAVERRQAILTTVRAHGAVSIHELARLTGSSEVTVRRDLRILEVEGQLSRRHGGAVVLGGSAYEPSYAEKAHVAAAEKAAIAELAATLVEDGDALIVGAGTTTQALARRLVRFRELTVVTNSLLVAQALARAHGIEVFVIGGSLRGSIHALVGGSTEQALSGLRTPKAFLSGNGLTAEHGLSTPNMLVASVDRAIMAAARQVIVLADHTKIGADTMMQTVPTSRIAVLVTDDKAPADELARFEEAGVDLRVTGVASTRAAST